MQEPRATFIACASGIKACASYQRTPANVAETQARRRIDYVRGDIVTGSWMCDRDRSDHSHPRLAHPRHMHPRHNWYTRLARAITAYSINKSYYAWYHAANRGGMRAICVQYDEYTSPNPSMFQPGEHARRTWHSSRAHITIIAVHFSGLHGC